MKNTISIIQALLIVFKLAELGAIKYWSWWVVLFPTWGGMCLALILLLAFGAVGDRNE